MSRRRPDLNARLDALGHAVELARGRCEPARLAQAESILAHASARRRLSAERTVVALAGGTGSGKSTLFNSLAGAPLAPTSVRRPTTSRSRAAIWPSSGPDGASADAAALLDWLDVRDRHDVSGTLGPNLAGLLLLDLPDFDSTAETHRIEADRLTEAVDLLVWVLDPQKYADAAVHERYLRPLSTHAEVMLVVLNQIDRLHPDAANSCQRHLHQLLTDDGLRGVPIIATSAARGEGMAQLSAELAARVRDRSASVQRLQADVDASIAALAPLCTSSGDRRRSRDAAHGEEVLVHGLAEAAGVPTVANAAAASYRLRATARMGWPLTRWLTRFRLNPLRKLHLGTGLSGTTSLPAAGGIAQAQVSNAVRNVVAERTGGLAVEWRRSAQAVVDAQQTKLPTELDRAVRAGDLSHDETPRWWAAVRLLHFLFLAAAIAGGVWLGVLAASSYVQLPQPTVHVGRAPLPTVLLFGGLFLGLLLAVGMRPFVAAGARRRHARARRSLDAGIRSVARRTVLEPLDAEIAVASEFCTALDAARR